MEKPVYVAPIYVYRFQICAYNNIGRIIIGGTAFPIAYTVAEVLVGPTISLLIIIIDPKYYCHHEK
jgi:hypothetical protein